MALEPKVVERLAQSRIKTTDHARQAGVAWAKERAEFSQLDRLGDWDSDRDRDLNGYAGSGNHFTMAQRAFYGLSAEEDGASNDDAERFWRNELGTGKPTDEAADSFVEGALEVINDFMKQQP